MMALGSATLHASRLSGALGETGGTLFQSVTMKA